MRFRLVVVALMVAGGGSAVALPEVPAGLRRSGPVRRGPTRCQPRGCRSGRPGGEDQFVLAGAVAGPQLCALPYHDLRVNAGLGW